MMSSNLEALGSRKLKSLFSKASKSNQSGKIRHSPAHHRKSCKQHTEAGSDAAYFADFILLCKRQNKRAYACKSGKNRRKLKSLFSKASKSKLLGVGVGAATTAVIQSSSATSVMVIGFVNAGIMTI